MAKGKGGVNLGDALLRIRAWIPPDFEKTLKGISKNLSSLGKQASLLGAGVTTAIVGTLTSFANWGDSMEEMSQRTGVTVKTLTELDYAAKRSGTSIDALEPSFKRMASVLTDARAGNETAIKSLDALKLKVTDFQGLNPDQVFDKFTAAIGNVADPLTRASIAQDIFGRAGTSLLPLLADGAKGLEEMRDRANKLGLTLTEAEAAAGGKFLDSFADLKDSALALAYAVTKELMPAVQGWIDWATDNFQGIKEWVKDHKELVTTVGGLALAFGGILSILGPALLGLSQFISIILKIPALIGGISTAISAVGTAFTAMSALLVANPVIAVIAAITAAIVGLSVLIYKNWDEIKMAWNDLWDGIYHYFAKKLEAIKKLALQIKDAIVHPIKSVQDAMGTGDGSTAFAEPKYANETEAQKRERLTRQAVAATGGAPATGAAPISLSEALNRGGTTIVMNHPTWTPPLNQAQFQEKYKNLAPVKI